MGVDSNAERRLVSGTLGGGHVADGGHGEGRSPVGGMIGEISHRQSFNPNLSYPSLELYLMDR